MKTRIILVDDHSMVRLGVRTMVERIANVEIVGEAENGLEAMELIERLNPDIALLDISMPKMNGLEVAKKVYDLKLPTKVLILSIYHDEEYVVKSIEYGCSGYLMKNADPEEVELAIKTLVSGENYYGANISKIMMKNMVQKQKETTTISQQNLTKREVEVIKMIAEGLKTKDIAEKLFISTRTVETHKTNIYHKLEIHNSAQLIRYAIKNSLITITS